MLRQHAHGIAQVLPRIFEPGKRSGVPMKLTGLRHPTESTARGDVRLVRRQTSTRILVLE